MAPLQAVDPYAVQVLTSNTLGSFVFLLWDILITFDDEVQCIWTKPASSWVKWLFLWTRYFTVAAQITSLLIAPGTTTFPLTPRFCKISLAIQSIIADVTMVVSVDVVLIIRVYALWNNKRWIAVVLATTCSIEAAIAMAGWILSLRTEYAYGCNRTYTPYAIFYPLTVVAALVTEVVILVLTLIRCVRFRRFGGQQSPIIFLMARDGIIAFVVIFIIAIVNLIFYVVLDPSISGLGYSWFISVASSAGCRLIISMQRLAKPPETDTFSLPTPEFTTNIFGGFTSNHETYAVAAPNTSPQRFALSQATATASVPMAGPSTNIDSAFTHENEAYEMTIMNTTPRR